MVTIYILVALFSSAVAIIAPIFVTVLVEFPFIILCKNFNFSKIFIKTFKISLKIKFYIVKILAF